MPLPNGTIDLTKNNPIKKTPFISTNSDIYTPFPPPESDFLVTQDNDPVITQANDFLITN